MNDYIAGLLVMVVLATLGGWLISARKQKVEKPVRIMLFVLYFWILMFVQTVLFSLGYVMLKA